MWVFSLDFCCSWVHKRNPWADQWHQGIKINGWWEERCYPQCMKSLARKVQLALYLVQTITKTKVCRKSFDNNYISPDKEWWVSWESFHSPLFRDSSGFQDLVSHKPASKRSTATSAITQNHQECPPIFKTNLSQSHGLVGLTVGALIQFKWVPTDDIRTRNHNPWMGQPEEKQTKNQHRKPPEILSSFQTFLHKFFCRQ